MDENTTDIFDKETTVSRNSGDIERLLIMQRREEAILDVKRYLDTPPGSTSHTHARRRAKNDIKMLLSRIGHLIKTSNQETHDEIKRNVEEEQLEAAITNINIYLTQIGLTHFHRKKIDTTNTETENLEKEL